jgi:ribokinase
VVVVGSINLDLVVRAARLPQPGETIRGSDFETIPGGKGANQAVAAARLGAETCMVGRVGADDFGRQLRKDLADNGVDVAHVTADREHPTGIALIVVQASGENSIIVVGGANAALAPAKLRQAKTAIATADVVLLQLEIPLETVAAVIQAAAKAGVRTILDAGPATDAAPHLIAAPDVISPNLVEAEALLGHGVTNAEQAARELVAHGAKAAVVKAGAQGCAWATLRGSVPRLRSGRTGAARVQVVDTTAAGDAFTAALGVALAEGKDLAAAAKWANLAGALAVTRFGAQPSMPTRAELEDFVARKG